MSLSTNISLWSTRLGFSALFFYDTYAPMKTYNYESLGALIADRILEQKDALRAQFHEPHTISRMVIDDLLPEDLATELYQAFPKASDMLLNNSLAERKWVSANMDAHHPLLKDVIFAFQHPSVLAAIADIIEKQDLHADPTLYAGGLTLMTKGHYLHPHIDHSHDRTQTKWRNLNLLYYVNPRSASDVGGNLELWHDGPGKAQETIESCFNRLIVMATHDLAYHSVSPIQTDFKRCCISNYFFGDTPMRSQETYHVTTFRGRKTGNAHDAVLRLNAWVRQGARTLFPKGLVKSKQDYQRADSVSKSDS
jgi:Rps23 Pro-64 3,4-dihydroxylase Tpa1-like proline 4-hydroxylase